jgi:hypothetical protein
VARRTDLRTGFRLDVAAAADFLADDALRVPVFAGAFFAAPIFTGVFFAAPIFAGAFFETVLDVALRVPAVVLGAAFLAPDLEAVALFLAGVRRLAAVAVVLEVEVVGMVV